MTSSPILLPPFLPPPHKLVPLSFLLLILPPLLILSLLFTSSLIPSFLSPPSLFSLPSSRYDRPLGSSPPPPPLFISLSSLLSFPSPYFFLSPPLSSLLYLLSSSSSFFSLTFLFFISLLPPSLPLFRYDRPVGSFAGSPWRRSRSILVFHKTCRRNRLFQTCQKPHLCRPTTGEQVIKPCQSVSVGVVGLACNFTGYKQWNHTLNFPIFL